MATTGTLRTPTECRTGRSVSGAAVVEPSSEGTPAEESESPGRL